MLNGLIKPDTGRITMRGRVGALIALGAGFNPILTGRENVYVNGTVLGLGKKEIDAKFDDIVDFAGIGEFIDAPVQSYSSGMTVRLGFAVASALRPDILIVDEVLAVGDAAFRFKCFDRLLSIMNAGCACIIVTHNMVDLERVASRVAGLHRGNMRFNGNVTDGIGWYYLEQGADSAESMGNVECRLVASKTAFKSGENIVFQLELTGKGYTGPAELSIRLKSADGTLIAGVSTATTDLRPRISTKATRYAVQIEGLELLGGHFAVDASVVIRQPTANLGFFPNVFSFKVDGERVNRFGLGYVGAIKLDATFTETES